MRSPTTTILIFFDRYKINYFQFVKFLIVGLVIPILIGCLVTSYLSESPFHVWEFIAFASTYIYTLYILCIKEKPKGIPYKKLCLRYVDKISPYVCASFSVCIALGILLYDDISDPKGLTIRIVGAFGVLITLFITNLVARGYHTENGIEKFKDDLVIIAVDIPITISYSCLAIVCYSLYRNSSDIIGVFYTGTVVFQLLWANTMFALVRSLKEP